MTAPEKLIRDHLAANLELLEPEHRLSLIATEFHVPNPRGADGFIDILAKDAYETWVVIELKRSNTSARQALHEVAKYTELLRREKALPKNRIRSVIVSTSWHDLLTSASNFARDWSHDLRGYEIVAAPDGRILSTAPKTWAPEPFEHHPSKVHCTEVYATPEEREQGWRDIVELASDAQAHHLIGFDFDRVSASELVDGDYLLYFAIGKINPDLVPLQRVLEVVPEPEEEEDPYFEVPEYYLDHPAEYRALHHICRWHKAIGVSRNSTPEDFITALDDPSWRPKRVRRTGAYAESDLLTDEDLYQAVAGQHGDAGIRRRGRASPDIRPRWDAEREATLRVLAGNDDWSLLMDQWLSEAESDPACIDVDVYAYNPCDLMQTLVHGLVDERLPFEGYAPMIRATATYDGGRTRMTFGGLIWDGRHQTNLVGLMPPRLRDPMDHAVLRSHGLVWGYDSFLLSSWGLRYALMDVNPLGVHNGVLELRMVDEDEIVRIVHPHSRAPFMRPDGAMPHMLRDFVREHMSQVRQLVDEHLRVWHGLSP